MSKQRNLFDDDILLCQARLLCGKEQRHLSRDVVVTASKKTKRNKSHVILNHKRRVAALYTTLTMSTNKILFEQFIADHEIPAGQKKKQTHTLFAGQFVKVLSIPPSEQENFNNLYLNYVSELDDDDITGLNAISEKTNTVFPLFFDLDFDVNWFAQGTITQQSLKGYIDETRDFMAKLLCTTFGRESVEEVVAKRLNYKLHLHYPDVIVNKDQAKALRTAIVKHMANQFPGLTVLSKQSKRKISLWEAVFDKSVYSSGLRMLFSHKGTLTKKQEIDVHTRLFPNEPYRHSYAIHDDETHQRPSLVALQKCSIKATQSVPDDFVDSSLLDSLLDTTPQMNSTDVVQTVTESIGMMTMDEVVGENVDLQSDVEKKLYTMVKRAVSEKTGIVVNVQGTRQISRSGCLRLDLDCSACPFKGMCHRRTSERNVSALWVLVTPMCLTLRCWKCTERTLHLCDTTTDLQETLFGTTVEERMMESCLFKQTHEHLTEFMLYKLKDSYAASPLKSGFTWYYYSRSQHRWVQKERIVTEIMGENNVIQAELRKYMLKVKDIETDEKRKKMISEQWNKLTNCLQNYNFVHGSVMPLLARKLHMFYSGMKNVSFAEMLDENAKLVGFKNGVWDFTSWEFRDGKPEDFISKTTGCDYQPLKHYPVSDVKQMEEALQKVWPDKIEYDYVLKQIASCLDGTPISQRFFILTGFGANGKSTVVRLLNAAFGDYTGDVGVTLFTRPRPPSSSPTEDLVSIKGRRFIFCSEPNANDSLFLGTIKWLSGGDRIACRGLYEKQQFFYPQCTIFMLTNDIPPIRASQQDHGTWRRIQPWVFSSEFVESNPTKPNQFLADPDLEAKIAKWKAMFASLLIEYHQSVKTYPKPQKFKELELKLRSQNDVYNRFVSEYIVKSNDPESDILTPCTSVFRMFTDWIKSFRISKEVPYDIFERQMIPLLGMPVEKNGGKFWAVELNNVVAY